MQTETILTYFPAVSAFFPLVFFTICSIYSSHAKWIITMTGHGAWELVMYMHHSISVNVIIGDLIIVFTTKYLTQLQNHFLAGTVHIVLQMSTHRVPIQVWKF